MKKVRANYHNLWFFEWTFRLNKTVLQICPQYCFLSILAVHWLLSGIMQRVFGMFL